MYMYYIIRLRHYIRREGKETGIKSIYYQFSCLVNIYRVEQDLRSGPSRTQQNLVDLAEYGRMRQIVIRLLQIASRLPSDCHFTVGLFLLSQWKQVDMYKVLRRCPITTSILLNFIYPQELINKEPKPQKENALDIAKRDIFKSIAELTLLKRSAVVPPNP